MKTLLGLHRSGSKRGGRESRETGRERGLRAEISLEMAIQHVEVGTRRDVVSRIFLVEDLA